MLLPLVVAVALAPAPDVDAVAGLYRLSQMEMGGGLMLTANGRFRYQLDYGAVSEAAEGRWTVDAAGVHLISEPLSMETMRELERSDAGFKDQLLRVEGDSLVLERYDARMIFHRVTP